MEFIPEMSINLTLKNIDIYLETNHKYKYKSKNIIEILQGNLRENLHRTGVDKGF